MSLQKLINDKKQIIKLFDNAIKTYEHNCSNNPAGAKGIIRKASFVKLFDALKKTDEIDLHNILIFYQKEKR